MSSCSKDQIQHAGKVYGDFIIEKNSDIRVTSPTGQLFIYWWQKEMEKVALTYLNVDPTTNSTFLFIPGCLQVEDQSNLHSLTFSSRLAVVYGAILLC